MQLQQQHTASGVPLIHGGCEVDDGTGIKYRSVLGGVETLRRILLQEARP